MPHPIPGAGPPWLRTLAGAVAALWLVSMLGSGVGARWTNDLPPTFRYFTQVACLFPHAARMAIEYRVEGWRCGERRFAELDTRPYFPVRADDKENRLHRAGFFFRKERVVMEALEDYLVARVNDDATPGDAIGGIRLVSLRHPLPPIQARPIPRFERKPLAAIPEDQVKAWFYTPPSRRARRCEVAP